MTTAATTLARSPRWWTWPLAGALLIAAVVLLSEPFSPDDAPMTLPEELADEPDLYIEDATITQYLPGGAIKYVLVSSQIRHFDQTNLTHLAMPTLTLHQSARPPWKIKSDRGFIRQRPGATGATEEVVYLRRNVALEQRFEDGRRLRLESPYLYIYPDRQYAETDQAVMIDTDVGRTTGVGLRGDLKRGVLKLSSSGRQRVHTIVLPGQFK